MLVGGTTGLRELTTTCSVPMCKMMSSDVFGEVTQSKSSQASGPYVLSLSISNEYPSKKFHLHAVDLPLHPLSVIQTGSCLRSEAVTQFFIVQLTR
ncbi:hypothetical protein EG68_01954 [Paragonimus skrjabini miyazakii]|uniref:Uncharacterized protein n=1 Tax=Paragonimus skrjabini miyazakii TaxID=59628 RepID=A0A8S9ZB45_9TREM|nr:hypothetical protein EG68_01954 [Paragonimus skrjabini miyazakii]